MSRYSEIDIIKMVKDIDEKPTAYIIYGSQDTDPVKYIILIIKWNKIVDIPSVDKYTCLNASFETNKRIAD